MKIETKKIPAAACTFALEGVGEVVLAAAAEGVEQEARFEIQALSGKVIPNHWFWGNLAIELSGIQGKGRVPVLVDHDIAQRIGVSDDREIDARRGLLMRGKFLGNTLAQQIRGESKDGFPWEASVRVLPLKVERIGEGVEAECNGQRVKGPGHIFRRSQLREVSFTALGADSNTSAAALGQSDEVSVEITNLSEEPMDKDEETQKNQAAAAASAAAETALAENIRKEAVQAERNRAAQIRAAAAPQQAALVDELIVGGAEISHAQARLAEDLRNRFNVLMNQFANHEGSRSSGNRANDGSTKLAEINAMEEGRDKWAARWDHDAKLREAFLRKDDYLALQAVELAGWNPQRIPRLRGDNGQPLAVKPWDEVALAASSPSGLVTVNGIRAGYAMALQAALGLSWARDVASAFPTNSPSETYPWLRSAPNPRKWEGERTVQELQGDVVTIVNDEYENSIEFKVPDLRRDKTGQIMARASDLATRIAFFPEHLVTSLLTTNGNAYDGKAFFATNHTVGSSGTINNAKVAGDGLAGGATPSTAQMSSNILLLMSSMLGFLDDQGQPLNEAARQFIIMTPANLFGPTAAAISAMFTSASATNPLGELARYGFSFRPVLNARLTTTNQVYMFRADAGIRSLLLQEEGVNPVELGPDSEHAKKTNRVLFGHGWQGGVGYGRFEMAIRGTTS